MSIRRLYTGARHMFRDAPSYRIVGYAPADFDREGVTGLTLVQRDMLDTDGESRVPRPEPRYQFRVLGDERHQLALCSNAFYATLDIVVLDRYDVLGYRGDDPGQGFFMLSILWDRECKDVSERMEFIVRRAVNLDNLRKKIKKKQPVFTPR